MEYKPEPLDTSKVDLTPEIRKLTELLARNTRDVWAQHRIAEGWRYGPHPNDERKEHPCLVPYEELSEIEKEYDRNTSLETLKAILAIGYRIEETENSSNGQNGQKHDNSVATEDQQNDKAN